MKYLNKNFNSDSQKKVFQFFTDLRAFAKRKMLLHQFNLHTFLCHFLVRTKRMLGSFKISKKFNPFEVHLLVHTRKLSVKNFNKQRPENCMSSCFTSKELFQYF